MKVISPIFVFILFWVFVGCEQPAEVTDQQESVDKVGTQDVGPTTCNLEELGINSALGSPQSINEAVELINALPRPLNIPCFLSALNRPLKINLTNSTRSAQPARGSESPRIFIMNYPLIMSLAVEGGGSYFIEFSEYTSETKSIKGELKFPINESQIDVSKPLQKIDTGFASSCLGCHRQEEKISHPEYPVEVYESIAIKPSSGEKVEISNFKSELYKCEFLSVSNYRCEMIKSLFNHGQLVHEDFSAETLTFVQTLGL